MGRIAFGLGVLLAVVAGRSAPAGADTFGGFSGIDAGYLVNQDRLCIPVDVKSGVATGAPTCTKTTADVIASGQFKPPAIAADAFTATAAGRTLTIANQAGAPVVTWQAADPIERVIEVYATQYGDRVAVAYSARVYGKEVMQVVAFVLVKTTGRSEPVTGQGSQGSGATPGPSGAGGQPVSVDPAVEKAAAAARKATGPAAFAAWRKVLALDATSSEAQFRIASLEAAKKQSADAIAGLQMLAKSQRADAIEWLVEARFDPAFAGVRVDPAYRRAVGLDRAPASTYERLMGLGGQWLQNGTQCDIGEVHFTAKRDRTFAIKFRSNCGAHSDEQTFRGTWAIAGDAIELRLPPARGQPGSAADIAPCRFEPGAAVGGGANEDALRCALDKDLEFVVLPVRQ